MLVRVQLLRIQEVVLLEIIELEIAAAIMMIGNGLGRIHVLQQNGVVMPMLRWQHIPLVLK